MNRYREMEALCRKRAEQDEKAADSWLEEAKLWSDLMKVEQRLEVLRASQEKGAILKRA